MLLAVVTLLQKNSLPYLLTGSFAASFYGYPRATHDIDILVEIDLESLKKLAHALSTLGAAYVFSKRDFTESEGPKMVNVYHKTTGTKIDFWVTDTEKFAGEFRRKRRSRLGGANINLVSPEDLILTKLLWCKEIRSERHLLDCAGIWRVQKGKLDEHYLRRRARELSVLDLLREISSIDIEKERF